MQQKLENAKDKQKLKHNDEFGYLYIEELALECLEIAQISTEATLSDQQKAEVAKILGQKK